MQLSEKLLAKASGRAEKSWVFRIRGKSVNQISVFILRGRSARSSDTEYRNTVYLGGGGIKSSQWIQISVFSFFLRGGIIIIGRGTSKMVQMADGSFVRRGKNKNIYR